MSGQWTERADRLLRGIETQGRWRAPRTFDATGPVGQLAPVGDVVSFASNDYLGLTHHPVVVAAAHEAVDRWGTGSGASRLVTGSRPIHEDLERDLAAWKGTEAAVTFPTGFAANLGVLTVLGATGVRIVSDELNHASIVDGARLARADVVRYRHGDAEDLESVLSEVACPTVVITDTVFSMDGDAAPLGLLAKVCRGHDALLVLDEAHAVFGPDVTEDVVRDLVVLRVGTLSKTLGSLGGFVAGPKIFMDLIQNLARSYIFTTAPSPADAAAARAALGVLRGTDGARRIARLRALVERVEPGHPSPIIPVILGDEARALEASASLLEAGLWVPAIRPPSVPPGTSRLRITLSADHTDDHVDRLLAALAQIR